MRWRGSMACLFFLGVGGANFAVYTLWLPEQYRSECRGSAFAFATSFGRFIAAGVTLLVGAGVARMRHDRHADRHDLGGVSGGNRAAAAGGGNRGQGASGVNLTQLFDLSLIGRRDVVALEFGGRTFTFGELDARSNRLAQLLARRGIAGGRPAGGLPGELAWR